VYLDRLSTDECAGKLDIFSYEDNYESCHAWNAEAFRTPHWIPIIRKLALITAYCVIFRPSLPLKSTIMLRTAVLRQVDNGMSQRVYGPCLSTLIIFVCVRLADHDVSGVCMPKRLDFV
jgi:hypothetical protein